MAGNFAFDDFGKNRICHDLRHDFAKQIEANDEDHRANDGRANRRTLGVITGGSLEFGIYPGAGPDG